jgi:hypothetical protein
VLTQPQKEAVARPLEALAALEQQVGAGAAPLVEAQSCVHPLLQHLEQVGAVLAEAAPELQQSQWITTVSERAATRRFLRGGVPAGGTEDRPAAAGGGGPGGGGPGAAPAQYTH